MGAPVLERNHTPYESSNSNYGNSSTKRGGLAIIAGVKQMPSLRQ